VEVENNAELRIVSFYSLLSLLNSRFAERIAQMLLKKLSDAEIQADRHLGIGNHVGEPGQRQKFELPARAKQGLGHFQRMEKIDVVVGRAMNDQERHRKVLAVRDDA